MKSKASIIVSGMIASDPGQGGATWAVLQYVLGLRRLGHEVFLVEPIKSKAVRPSVDPLAASDNAVYFRSVTTDFGLQNCSTLLLAGTQETAGLSYAQLRQVARRADALINISGLLTDQELTAHIPIRAYLDLDPAFNQLWHAVQGLDMRFTGHTHHVTIGHNLGEPDCPVPTCGLSWIKTCQPIVLEHWPVAERIPCYGLTTIANWRGYGSIEHRGVFYGQKAHSLRQFLSVPAVTGEECLLAMAIHPSETKDLAALAQHGWKLADPTQVAGTPARYQQFIQDSKAEFGIAKSGYVTSRCGWFSDRSLCYLASGRPVLAQDTGFGRYLPTGEGLFAFATSDDVLRAVTELRTDYPKQARRARALAEEFFDSNKVLPGLLDQLGI